MAVIDRTPLPRRRMLRSALRGSVFALPLLLTIAVSGCASSHAPEITGSISSAPMTDADFEKAAAYWGDRYAKNEADKTVALNYAAALRRINRNDQAIAVLQKATLRNLHDPEVLAAYGKALAAGGDLDRALDVIRRAEQPDKPDWRLLSAEAAILDQKGAHDQARKLYLSALDLSPNEPTILSNLGMSYMLTGELSDAERVLRQAVAEPGADSRVRQNLALVVGLEGRFPEAEKIASAELSPDQAAANIAYLKSMLSNPDTWKQLKSAPGTG